MSGIYFQYGDYIHPAGEVYPQLIEARAVDSDRGYRWALDYRFQIGGNFCRDPNTPLTPELISTRIAELEAAYSDDYKDFGFKFANGTNTSHWVESDNTFNLTGNRVLARSWRYDSQAELANTRSFSITLGCRILANFSSVLYFQETVSQVGTGGPRWTFRERFQGIPIRKDITERTPVLLTQRGIIIGATASISPPQPWWPSDEQEDQRIIERVSPRLHGHPSFGKFTHYGVKYAYQFARAESPNQSPNTWWQ